MSYVVCILQIYSRQIRPVFFDIYRRFIGDELIDVPDVFSFFVMQELICIIFKSIKMIIQFFTTRGCQPIANEFDPVISPG